ncbi:ribokinase [Rossellomorea vietnamensis]|uniref:Ribokinase n=1 Tax=Rossellomorea vietnamensis TaxID=218284 RepID=A0A5D4M057_9BACI|nr:ribokinase [Rossellomorea vietnamensis]TYR94882.1 ribokinase [Rossellomorea vietnamensis]
MITVLGSLNMDLVTVTKSEPQWGETVIGEEFHTHFGGKGANQAVAASKVGADVHLIGAVGDDLYGKEYIQHLQKLGINTEAIHSVANSRTGTASITVRNSENKIIVIPGANGYITTQIVEKNKELIKRSDWLLLQLEIPQDSVGKAIDIAYQYRVGVILNPAPYQQLPREWIDKITYLTPNELEAELVLKNYPGNRQTLLNKMIITKGSKGVTIFFQGKEVNIPAYKVDALDSTGAGDTFNGGLAAALAEGKPLRDACIFASKAAAISVTKLGAQSGMPTRMEMEST